MKNIFLAMALFLAAVPTQTLTQEERDRAVAELEGSKKAFLDATKGLSPAQSNFKAAPDRWSVAECSEHIALAEGLDRKSTRLNSSHSQISYAVFCLKKKKAEAEARSRRPLP